MIREVAQISIREDARGQFVADLSRAVAEILPDVEGVIEFVARGLVPGATECLHVHN